MITVRLQTFTLNLLFAASIFCAFATANASTLAAQSVNAIASDGKIVCNEGGALSQVSGHPDYFVGRSFGIGTLDYCHSGITKIHANLVLFKMDWVRHELVFQHELLNLPVRTASGFTITDAYDPYVARYRGELWVASECSVQGKVSTCLAPLLSDLSRIDTTRMTVPLVGREGPYENHPLVTLVSASAPVLLSARDTVYLYWQVDFFANTAPQNLMVTRGIPLAADSEGRLWGQNSGGRPVETDDPRLTTTVHDVVQSDLTKNHVAVTWDLVPVQGNILEISSIGGTAGEEVCRSPHDKSPGCWRISLSEANTPLGNNVFGQHPLPKSGLLPGNTFSYARVIVDPSGHHFLMGWFEPSHSPFPAADRAPPITQKGIQYIPFEPKEFLDQ